MAGLLEQDKQFRQRRADFDGLDVRARHHDVLDAHLAQPEDVAQHGTLAGRKGRAVGLGLGQGVDDLLAQRRAIALLEITSQPLEQGWSLARRL